MARHIGSVATHKPVRRRGKGSRKAFVVARAYEYERFTLATVAACHSRSMGRQVISTAMLAAENHAATCEKCKASLDTKKAKP